VKGDLDEAAIAAGNRTIFSAHGILAKHRSKIDRGPLDRRNTSLKAITEAEILAHFEELDLCKGLLTHKSPSIRLQTLQYLTDRRDGKAKPAVEVARYFALLSLAQIDNSS
jgi:hypothetical protein